MTIRFLPLLMKKNVSYGTSVCLGEPNLPPKRPRKSIPRSLRDAWNHSHLATKLLGSVERRLVGVLQPLTLFALQYTLYSIGLHLALQLGEHDQQAQVPSTVFAVSPDSLVDQVNDQPASLEFGDGSQGVLERSEDTITSIHDNNIPRLGLAENSFATRPLGERHLESTDRFICNRIH